MELTARALWTLLHGMGFGALYLLGCSGAFFELIRHYAPNSREPVTEAQEQFFGAYLTGMAALAWFAVLSGTYVIYPWYRAVPPAGTAPLEGFPQRLLLSSGATSGWHSIGMEWKEHVAWLVPMAITMAAVVFLRYRRSLRLHTDLRNAVLSFLGVAFVAAGIAGFFGAMLNKYAPVEGGPVIRILHGGAQ